MVGVACTEGVTVGAGLEGAGLEGAGIATAAPPPPDTIAANPMISTIENHMNNEQRRRFMK
jgi:hypothetical protein